MSLDDNVKLPTKTTPPAGKLRATNRRCQQLQLFSTDIPQAVAPLNINLVEFQGNIESRQTNGFLVKQKRYCMFSNSTGAQLQHLKCIKSASNDKHLYLSSSIWFRNAAIKLCSVCCKRSDIHIDKLRWQDRTHREVTDVADNSSIMHCLFQLTVKTSNGNNPSSIRCFFVFFVFFWGGGDIFCLFVVIVFYFFLFEWTCSKDEKILLQAASETAE